MSQFKFKSRWIERYNKSGYSVSAWSGHVLIGRIEKTLQFVKTKYQAQKIAKQYKNNDFNSLISEWRKNRLKYFTECMKDAGYFRFSIPNKDILKHIYGSHLFFIRCLSEIDYKDNEGFSPAVFGME